MVECHLAKVKVAGPNPVSRSIPKLATMTATSCVFVAKNAPLAQLVEQLTLNQWVPGSNP